MTDNNVDAVNVSVPKKSEIKSAFEVFYFLLFLYATWNMFVSLGGVKNPIHVHIEELIAFLADTKFFEDFYFLGHVVRGIFWLFAGVFALHLVRIYITLELMEDKRGPFENFFASYSTLGRVLDFVSRVAIVIWVSFKVFRPQTYDDFMIYFCGFYAALTVWALVAMWGGGKSPQEAFLWSSLAGLVTAMSVHFFPIHWMLLIVIYGLATYFLGKDLLKRKGNDNSIYKYGRIFYEKWKTGWTA